MGVVVRVVDRRLGRPAAIKLVRPPVSPTRVARLRREAAITARLEHPAIPPVYEAGTTPDGLPYLAMRVVEGRPLEDLLRAHHAARPGWGAVTARLERRALLDVVVKVAEAVAYAHGQGVVHRDLKPANILVGRFGEVYVMDWGLAKRLEAPGSTVPELTQEGALLGTPGYCAPEQAEGRADPRSDVFSLGVVLAEVLTGTLPAGFGAEWLAEADDVPDDLRGVVARALARDPDDRTDGAEELVSELKAWLAGEDVPGHRYRPPERLLRAVRRRPGLAAALVLTSGLLATSGALGAAALEARRRQLTAEGREREAAREREVAAAREREAEATRGRLERAMHLLAEAEGLLRQGEREAAFARMDEALAADPSRLLLRHAARACLEVRERDRARALLERAIERFPPGLEELHLLHVLEAEERDLVPGSAVTPALERLRRAPGSEESAIVVADQAETARQEGRLDEALRLATRALALDPTLAQAANVRGVARHDQGDLAGAIEDFRLAVALGPRHAGAWSNLGWALSLAGRHEEGLAALDRSLSITPSRGARLNRGNVLQSLRRYSEAIAEFDALLAARPRAPLVLCNRGNAKFLSGAHGEALADHDACLALAPGHAPAHFGRGLALMKLGRHGEALAAFEEQVRLQPSNPQAFGQRGRCRAALGQPAEALADLERALELGPRHPDAPGWRREAAKLREGLAR
ncbi:MAG: tetratricopeptide repeat protein [Planctomycetes bacterium]|nr:tetratricopeptide repeat protein [Planctomycetota bacterium]